MEGKRIKSRPGLFGYTNYYDERGRYVGKSRPGALGTTVYFDEKGRPVGKSHKGFLAKEVYHDGDFERHISTYGCQKYPAGCRVPCNLRGYCLRLRNVRFE